MRPHRLRVTAFGPFPGTVEVDLDEVSGAGPFLLRGATGAGKTSLLDAVGYALFGKVPGSRGLKQLRSDHAGDGVRTSVELWASIGGRAVHVVRTPDQRRPKARGGGTTTDKATVSVRVAPDLLSLDADECDARWAGVQEANDELARLVGMTHEQFVQVVLLPQGDFARFLRARDDDRAGVLRALFDTRRFTAVEQHLREQRDLARDALAAAGTRVAAAAARVAAAASVPEVPTSGLTGWAEDLLALARAEAAAAAVRAEQASATVLAARSRHTRAAAVADRLGGLLVAARAEASLLDAAPAVALVAHELAAADRAAEVATLHALQVQARQRVEAASVTAAALARESGLVDAGLVGGLEVGWDCAGGPDPAAVQACVGAAETRHQDAVRSLAHLEALGRDVERWQSQRAALQHHRSTLSDAEGRLVALRSSVAALPARVVALVADLGRSREEAAGLAAAAQQVDRWEALGAAAERLVEQMAQVAAAEAAHLQARAAAREAEGHHDDLRRARLTGMSVELAARLVPGEPCTVCGAVEHPTPAQPLGPQVGADDEAGARDRAARAADAAARAGAALAHAQARRDATHQHLVTGAAPTGAGAGWAGSGPVGSDLAGWGLAGSGLAGMTVPDLAGLDPAALMALRAGPAARVRAAQEALDLARAASGRAEAQEAELADARAAVEAAGPLVAEAEAEVAGCRAALASCESEVDRLAAGLVEALGERAAGQDVAAVHGDLVAAGRRRVERDQAATVALTALAGALVELRRCEQAAADAARDAGWSGTAEAVAAARTRAWRDAARIEVSRHDRDLHAASEQVVALRHELAVDGVALTAPGGCELVEQATARAAATTDDVGILAAGLAVAEGAWLDADRDRTRAVARLTGLSEAVPLLLGAERASGASRAEAEAARALADLCSGANDKGVPLSTYVLAAHLQQVVEAANLRLHGMSEGRYALVHVEEGEDRRRRAGLGLAVLDGWTGRRRPAGTLSGGETFLASLALALGLADVVTAEAGGVRIDALFVDEGFGTLDPESLDRAMDVLDGLQEHGRMVGVVSHVAELRQRLPRQVHVEAGRGGSTVRVSAG